MLGVEVVFLLEKLKLFPAVGAINNVCILCVLEQRQVIGD